MDYKIIRLKMNRLGAYIYSEIRGSWLACSPEGRVGMQPGGCVRRAGCIHTLSAPLFSGGSVECVFYRPRAHAAWCLWNAAFRLVRTRAAYSSEINGVSFRGALLRLVVSLKRGCWRGADKNGTRTPLPPPPPNFATRAIPSHILSYLVMEKKCDAFGSMSRQVNSLCRMQRNCALTQNLQSSLITMEREGWFLHVLG